MTELTKLIANKPENFEISDIAEMIKKAAKDGEFMPIRFKMNTEQLTNLLNGLPEIYSATNREKYVRVVIKGLFCDVFLNGYVTEWF